MNQVEQFIEEYAHLEHKAAIYRANGRAVPAEITLRMEGIAAWGKANIHPAHFAAAIRQKDGRLAQLHMMRGEMEQQQTGNTNQRLIDNAVGKVTKGILGQRSLNANQLAAIVNGEPLRARVSTPRLTQIQIDEQVRQATKAIDPAGKGWGEKEFNRRMDQLIEANPEEFAKLVVKYNITPSQARKAANFWRSKRVEIGLQHRVLERQKARGGEPKNPVIKDVKDSERRKATLATAMLADSIDQSERGDPEAFNGLSGRSDIPSYMLEERSSRGDMARAFEKVENREQIGYDG